MAGTSAAQIPHAPALLPWPKGFTRSSLGRAAKLLWWVITAVPRLLLVSAISTVWEGVGVEEGKGEGMKGGRGGGGGGVLICCLPYPFNH